MRDKKSRRTKSLSAILTILTMVFSLFGGITFMPIKAQAESVVGTVVNVGDTIDFGGAYVAWDNSTPSNILDFSSVTIYSVEYDKFWDLWMLETNRELQDFYVKSNIADSKIAPVGFKVSGGTGTKLDPYTIEAVYGEYTVTYDANGAVDGSIPTEILYSYNSGDSVTVLGNTGELMKYDCNFDGWNTKADGTGTSYSAGETFIISQNTVLYAQWTEKPSLIGRIVEIGDTIDFDNANVVADDASDNPESVFRFPSVKLTRIYRDESYGQWEFWASGLCIRISGTFDKPAIGFKVSGGKGTETDPYTFEIVYDESPHTHILTKIERVPAACEQEGYEEYWKCSVCNKLFSDSNGKNEIYQPIEINPLGHDWGEWVVIRPATDDVYGEKIRACKRDTSHIEVRSIDKLSHIPVVPQTQGGLQQGEDGDFYYCKDGEVVTDKNGYVEWNDSKFFITNGKVDTTVTGLVQDVVNTDDWYYCAEGQVVSYTGLTVYDEEWFYVENGRLDITKGGFVEYDGSMFFVAAGQIARKQNFLTQDPNTKEWYYLAEGQVVDVTTLAEYDGEWFYIIKGKLADDYTGTVEYNGAEFNVVNGMVR